MASKAEQPRAEPAEGTQETDSKSGHLEVTELIGDIFDAPDNAVLIHACNAVGSWGAGIAAAFLTRYPNAFKVYHKHCKDASISTGTALLIPPCEKSGPKHYVGCLFTSAMFGKRRDPPEEILNATGPAMEDLMQQIKEEVANGKEVSEVRMCKINSGLFRVPWEKSREVVEGLEALEAVPHKIIVYSPN